MTYANSTERAALISGLRQLAEYLESTPQVATPVYHTVYVFPARDDWAEMCADIESIAAFLGVRPIITVSGHYVAVRDFGPVEFRAVAIPPTAQGE